MWWPSQAPSVLGISRPAQEEAMSTDQHLSTHAGPPTASGTRPEHLGASPARVRIVAVALAVAAVAEAAMLIWRPWGERNATGYGDMAPIRDNLWTRHPDRRDSPSPWWPSRWPWPPASSCSTEAADAADRGAVFDRARRRCCSPWASSAHAAVGGFATSEVDLGRGRQGTVRRRRRQPLRVMAPVMRRVPARARSACWSARRCAQLRSARRAALDPDQPDRADAGAVRAGPRPRCSTSCRSS